MRGMRKLGKYNFIVFKQVKKSKEEEVVKICHIEDFSAQCAVPKDDIWKRATGEVGFKEKN